MKIQRSSDLSIQIHSGLSCEFSILVSKQPPPPLFFGGVLNKSKKCSRRDRKLTYFIRFYSLSYIHANIYTCSHTYESTLAFTHKHTHKYTEQSLINITMTTTSPVLISQMSHKLFYDLLELLGRRVSVCVQCGLDWVLVCIYN